MFVKKERFFALEKRVARVEQRAEGLESAAARLEKRVAALEEALSAKLEEESKSEKLFQDGLASIMNYGGKAAERE